MEEGKLNMDNGDELPAFFPKKNKKEPNMETKIPEFMPTAQDASIPIEGYDDPIEVGSKKTITMDELSDDEKSQLIIKLYKQIKENEVKLDDYIDSDFVVEPISNEIYKAKGLDTIVRYISSDDEYHKLDFHGSLFYLKIKDNELIKTTDLERSLYNENEEL